MQAWELKSRLQNAHGKEMLDCCILVTHGPGDSGAGAPLGEPGLANKEGRVRNDT